jgi:predicted TIM-barrel fold metal-dependent hydrolase
MPPSQAAGAQTGPEGLAPVGPARQSEIAGAWDCHVHVFGPASAYPFAEARAYTPPDALPDDLERMVTALRFDRFVLVQPSPYGFDNRRLLDALQTFGGRARGVVVLPPAARDLRLLRQWHALGVRGIRINLASGGALGPERLTEAFASAVRAAAEVGWHIELHVTGAALPWLPSLVEHSPVAVVLDHFGRIRAGTRHERDDLDRLERLLEGGRTWIKLSAPYRLTDQGASRADIARIGRALIRANPARLVWGSDWPHTASHPGAAKPRNGILPFRNIDPAAQLGLLHELVPDTRTRRAILHDNPEMIYQ